MSVICLRGCISHSLLHGLQATPCGETTTFRPHRTRDLGPQGYGVWGQYGTFTFTFTFTMWFAIKS